MKLSKLSGTIEQRVCLFGPPKVGKTRIAAMLATKYKLLVFDLENGSITMSQVPEEYHDRIDIIKIRDSRTYPIAIETMMKVIKGDAVNICVAHSKVSCPVCSKNKEAEVERVCLNEVGLDTVVIIDSLTQLTNSGIAHITKAQSDDYKLQLDDWGALKVLMDKFLSQVQVAKYNIVCITHEEEVKFEDGRVKIVPVAGSSNSSRISAKYFDHIIYCNVVNKKHVVGSATNYAMSVLTGSRTNVVLETASEPTLLDVFTNWKLPNYGMPQKESENADGHSLQGAGTKEVQAELSSVQVDLNSTDGNVAGNLSITSSELASMTPAQRALHNLRLKNRGVSE